MTIMDALIRNESSVFVKKFVLLEQIGQGSSSMVYRCKRISDGMICAVKIVSLKHLKFHYSQRDIEAASVKEIHILKELNNPSIVKIHEHFIEADHLFIIEEYAPGKELFEVILDKPKRCLTEDEAKPIIIQLIDAVEYLHSQEIVHRDIKPENIKLVYEGAEPRIKLLDFGVSRKLEHEKYAQTYVGTPSYLAPEMLRGRTYDARVDVWSAGVIVYVLLGGYPPFYAENQNDLFQVIMKGEYQFFHEDWQHISEDAKNLIRKMLVTSPAKRATAEELLREPWLRAPESRLSDANLGMTVENLKRFKAKQKFKGAVDAVKAVNRLRSLGSWTAARPPTTHNS
uniref:Protein kinase domain-containing protein n=1 Tax=Heterosigma akashiwo TaxID=2829 RepID=A0A7S3XZC6_HETAK